MNKVGSRLRACLQHAFAQRLAVKDDDRLDRIVRGPCTEFQTLRESDSSQSADAAKPRLAPAFFARGPNGCQRVHRYAMRQTNSIVKNDQTVVFADFQRDLALPGL